MSFSRVLLEAQEIIHFNKPSVKLNEQEPFLEDIIAYKILYELMLFLKYLDSDIFIKRIFFFNRSPSNSIILCTPLF